MSAGCKTACAYGACGEGGRTAGPYGCGGCCRCLGGCQVEYESREADPDDRRELDESADPITAWLATPGGTDPLPITEPADDGPDDSYVRDDAAADRAADDDWYGRWGA
jgi:hypothetical protein